MKSKTSCFNKTIFKKNITHFWPIWLLVLGWNLFVLPFMIFNEHLDWAAKNVSSMSEQEIAMRKTVELASLVQVFMNPIVIAIFSVVVVMAVFSYLYNTRAAYTMHALPVTRKELFITNYLSGLSFLVLPELIGFLFGVLVSALCGYTSLDYLLKGVVFAIAISFFFYSFAVAIAMLTGQLLAVPVFAVILNLLYIGCKSILTELVGYISYGLTSNYQSGRLDILSPIYYITRSVGIKINYMSSYPVCEGFYGEKAVCGYAIAALFFIAAAYIMYQKRKLETAGQLISISWIRPIFRWGAAMCGAWLFGMLFCAILDSRSPDRVFLSAVVFSVLFGIVFFFAAQMFLEKGFRVFGKKRFIECGVFSVVLIAVLCGIEFDVFGFEKKIPDISQIEKAYIDRNYPVGGSKEEEIKMVMELHRQMIESKHEFESYMARNDSYEKMTGIDVRYFLKDGSVMRRWYAVPAGDEILADEESVYSKVIDLTALTDSYLKNLFGLGYADINIKYGAIDLYEKEDQYVPLKDYEFTKEEANLLYQALLADLDAGNFRNVIELDNWGDDNIYYNTLNFSYDCGEGNKALYEDYNGTDDEPFLYYDWDHTSDYSASVRFNEKCENIINALIEIGAIESKDDLITIKDMNALEAEDAATHSS